MTQPALDLHDETNVRRPLADKVRPQILSEVAGQDHLTQSEGILSPERLKQGIPSLILWGPPGCGKTTIARLLAQELNQHFVTLSAVTEGKSDMKRVFETASIEKEQGKETLLFVDEIHRFNRAQQDTLLPFVENGTVTLIGATTENPSFELNSALLSRCKVLTLKRLDETAMRQLIARAEETMQKRLPISEALQAMLIHMADGDGRYLLNMCEELLTLPDHIKITEENLGDILQQRMPVYDKHQDSHYNLISALHKSLRGSDVQAALYWLARMLEGGEDPLYILRRLVRFASEDIGMADPQALVQANAAKEAYTFIGSPEGDLALAQCVIYLGTAPKSNAAYSAFKASARSAKTHGSLMPPKHILNAPTKLMKDEGYGKNYAYDHDTEHGFSGQNYFPDAMEREAYYQPKTVGFEREVQKRLDYWHKLRQKVST